ncbi:MAG: aminotransferase class I/II-fold pyridoxal phosphate-dependent enzyme [Elusimicrobiales bacterium]|nr:aminotransferase class I/II-fold pyridoxal phosphate-dependent enzyme [Elusimicrobiales bacterium]
MKIELSRKLKSFKPFLFEELYRKERAERAKGRDIISLAVGDPDLPTDRRIVASAAGELRDGRNHRYPNTKGNETLRREISAWHKRRHGLSFHPSDEVSILIGSKEGIAHLPFVVMNPGDCCLIPDPTYPTYRTGVVLSGGRIHDVPLEEKNDFLPDLGKIPQKVLARTKLFFLNYPNNPTGAGAGLDFYRDLVKWARKHNVIIAQDAAYCEMYFGRPAPSILQVPGARDVAVEFYSASKTYCMAGWRVGWVVGNSKLVCALNQLKENIDSGPFNAIQNAVAYGLKHHEAIVPPIRARFKARADAFCAALDASGWKFRHPGGSCFVWARPPVKASSLDAVMFMLDKAAILTAPGSGFGLCGEGYVRFSLTEPDARLKEAARRLRALDWGLLE